MRFTILYLLLACALTGFAQKKDHYTYITDRRFTDVLDLQGFPFNPDTREVKGEGKVAIAPGKYSFAITQNALYVAGEGVQGVYNINSINPAAYGYILTFMNARDPTIQGHLKVVLTPNKNVDVLIFKRTTKEKEIIFYLAEMPDQVFKDEGKYFTDLREMVIPVEDSIWGHDIYPFLIADPSNNQQARLFMEDSTYFKFIQTFEVIDKRKRKAGDPPFAKLSYPLPDSLVGNPDIKVEPIHQMIVKKTTYLESGEASQETKTLKVQSANLREVKNSPNPYNKFELTIQFTAGADMVIALDTNRKVSYCTFAGLSYLMRGF
jgi:hypothetical protein